MNVNRNGIVVSGVNAKNHTKNKRIVHKKYPKKESEQKTFVSMLKGFLDGSNQHIIQPYNIDEVRQLIKEGWCVEEIWDKKQKKEPYEAHDFEHV